MNKVFLEKITLNIGAGAGGQELENAKRLLQLVAGQTPVVTKARARNPTFKVRQGDSIGVKVTLRGKNARSVLSKSLEVCEKKLKETSFDNNGNVAFGVKEYIDYPGLKYDPDIGMMGFDVCVSLSKPGKRVARRRVAASRIPLRQKVSRSEAQDFLKKDFGVDVIVKD